MDNLTHWTLVTGGAARLGAQVCLDLAKKGGAVLVHYRTSEMEAKSLVKRCRELGSAAECIQGDFSSIETTENFIGKCSELYPHIVGLVNNVGNYLVKPASQTTPEEWNAIFQTNLHAPFAITRAFLPSLIELQGSVVNIGIAGIATFQANTYSTAYMASKMGLWMLTKSLAKELAPSFVRVNMVSPGYLQNAVDLPDDGVSLPMKRAATLPEVSAWITSLLDEQNGYITGQNVEIAGGVRL